MDFRLSLAPGSGTLRSRMQYTARPTEPSRPAFRSTSPFAVPFSHSERRYLQNSISETSRRGGARTSDDTTAPISRAAALAALQSSRRAPPPQMAPADADMSTAGVSRDDEAEPAGARADVDAVDGDKSALFTALLHTSARAPAALPGETLLRRTGIIERTSDAEVSRIAGSDGSVDAGISDGVIRSWTFWAQGAQGRSVPVCVWRTTGARFGCYNVVGPHATLCALFGQHRVVKEFASVGTSVRQWAPARTI